MPTDLRERTRASGNGSGAIRQNHGEYAEQSLTLDPAGIWSGAVIGMAGKDGRRSIELLGEHNGGKPMGQSHGPERQLEIGARQPLRREPLRATHEKGEARGPIVAKFADCPRELGAVKLIALAVEANQFV